ncbi:hypothetical protein ACPPVO_36445 [Dactylosporangium sp. McL0621]|uniref:hypothetical protein n=1 Tax=Dactylosporangium sp. McL0621 TaxID=3415678 RepID=UPI003CECEBE5
MTIRSAFTRNALAGAADALAAVRVGAFVRVQHRLKARVGGCAATYRSHES